MDKETCHRVEMGLCRSGRLIVAQDFTVKHSFQATLARKIRDFRTRKASPMVQIRCSRGFDTKKEAFACPNIPRQSVCSSQIFLIDRWSRSLINGRAVPMAEQFSSRPPSGG